jgi:hypothetical protein
MKVRLKRVCGVLSECSSHLLRHQVMLRTTVQIRSSGEGQVSCLSFLSTVPGQEHTGKRSRTPNPAGADSKGDGAVRVPFPVLKSDYAFDKDS